jgi:ribosomal protein RSM22 (predicted rRNA methylase)
LNFKKGVRLSQGHPQCSIVLLDGDDEMSHFVSQHHQEESIIKVVKKKKRGREGWSLIISIPRVLFYSKGLVGIDLINQQMNKETNIE